MSPEAIDLRLRDLAQLYELGVALREVRFLGPTEPLAPDAKEQVVRERPPPDDPPRR